MKTKSNFMMVSVLILIVFCLTAGTTYAFVGPTQDFGGGIKTLINMIGLTPAQELAIETALQNDGTLQGYKSQLKTDMTTLINARKTLELEVLTDLYNNTQISSDSKIGLDQAAVSSAEAALAPILAEIQLQVLQDIQTALTGSLALTPAQLARLKKIIAALE